MAIRKDPVAVLALLNGIRNQFKEVLPIPCDSDVSYIAFEAVSKKDHLNEDGPTRGSNCTSVDALIYAVDNNNESWIIPIEWKYTESYDDCKSGDKSNEGITYKIETNPHKNQKEKFVSTVILRWLKILNNFAQYLHLLKIQIMIFKVQYISSSHFIS